MAAAPITYAMQPEDIARRDVAWDPATTTLQVGGRSVVVTCDPGDNAALLRTYLDLVAEQRDVTLDGGVALRRDDIVVLSELLDLDDVDLEDRLREILHLSGREAAELHRRLRRQRMASAAIGVGMLAAGVPIGTAVSDAFRDGADVAPAATIASVEVPEAPGSPVTVTVEAPATTAPPPPPVEVPTLASIPDPIGDPVPDPVGQVTHSAPTPRPAPPVEAPAPAPSPAPTVAAVEVEAAEPADTDVEVGYTVTYERDPNFVAPEGVDIGDSMLIERDAPPAP